MSARPGQPHHRAERRHQGIHGKARRKRVVFEVDARLVAHLTVAQVEFEVPDPHAVVGAGEQLRNRETSVLGNPNVGEHVDVELFEFHIAVNDHSEVAVGAGDAESVRRRFTHLLRVELLLVEELAQHLEGQPTVGMFEVDGVVLGVAHVHRLRRGATPRRCRHDIVRRIGLAGPGPVVHEAPRVEHVHLAVIGLVVAVGDVW